METQQQNPNGEIWLPLNGYEGIYEISNMGRLYSIPRIVSNGKWERWYNGGILKPHINGITGYVEVCLTKIENGKAVGHTKKWHRVIAQHFLANPENKNTVNHINGVKTDNRVDNLEWATELENVLHAERTGLRHSKGTGNAFYGRNHATETKDAMSKNHWKKALLIDLNTGVYYESFHELATLLGVHESTLHARITRYKTEKRYRVA